MLPGWKGQQLYIVTLWQNTSICSKSDDDQTFAKSVCYGRDMLCTMIKCFQQNFKFVVYLVGANRVVAYRSQLRQKGDAFRRSRQ